MSFELPPIVRLAERLLVDIEEAVRRFPRYHKYTHGSELRRQAMEVARLTHRAWRDRRRQAEWLNELVWAIDDLKLNLQLGQRIQAFSSFAQFEHLARLVRDLGKQAGTHHLVEPERDCVALADEINRLRAVLAEAVELYGKPGGPWNVPSDPGGWLFKARAVLKTNAN